ncbi:MAG: carbohydrate ABC transporter permease [Bacilli bacterium]
MGIRRMQQAGLVAALSLIAMIALFPFIFMLVSSFKTNAQFYQNIWSIPRRLDFANYVGAWHQIQGYFLNSVYVAVISIIGVLLFASMAAFVLARYDFPAKSLIYGTMIGLLFVPGIATLIPLFILVKNLGLLNSLWALILPYWAGNQVMAIFLMRTFFENLPGEIFEAAKIDGANGVRMYWNLTIPLSRPIITTVAMVSLIGIWNDYIWPSVVISDNSLRTITIGLAFFEGEFITQWGQLFAGYVIASIPMLLMFVFGMRYFVSGIAGGVVK